MASRDDTSFSSKRGLPAESAMGRLLDDMLRGIHEMAASAPVMKPRLDFRETDTELCVVADLAGVAQADLDVRVDGNTLILSAERHREADQQQPDCRVVARGHGLVRRIVQLPFAPDPEQVRASYANGVLTVHLPRHSRLLPARRIEVQSGADRPAEQTDASSRDRSEQATAYHAAGGAASE
jgi:HSP20 family protein